MTTEKDVAAFIKLTKNQSNSPHEGELQVLYIQSVQPTDVPNLLSAKFAHQSLQLHAERCH